MDKKKKYLLGIGVLLIFSIIIGISYAYWSLTLKQVDKNVVMSDCFKITFVGENDINLTNAYPMQDSELYSFYESATPYHFTITNTCESNASGVINLETLSSAKKLADDYIDVILYEGTKNYLDIAKANSESTDVYSTKGEGRVYNDINIYDYSLKGNPINTEKVLSEALTAYKLHEFTLEPLEVKQFNLLEYMSQDTPPIDEVMNASFESKITVTMNYQKAPEKSMLRTRGCEYSNCTDITRVFQKDYINNATSIIFENTMDAPTTYVANFDESELQDKSIIAYVIANEDNPSTYTIRFQTNGIFLMPEDSSNYFRGFSKVTSIVGLENVDTSKVTNMKSMFSGMSSLTSLDLSNFETSNVTNMSSMFKGMTYLTNLDLSSFDTSKVTTMSSMFSGMSGLSNLNLSSLFDTSNVTNMSLMFDSCSGLTSLDLSSFDTSNVTNMSSMFSNCRSFTSLNLSGFDTSNVTTMSLMFSGCSSLTSLDLSSFDTSQVTNMNGMFFYCSSLTSLDLTPFDTSNVTNMSAMFYGMRSLTNLDLSGFDTSNVTNMSSMFSNCSSFTSLNLSGFDTSNVTTMSLMFSGCSSLTSLDLSSFDTSSVIGMQSMFGGCSGLSSLDLSGFNTSNVTDMSDMFRRCYMLTSLDVTSFDTSNVTNMTSMFYKCSSLTSLNLSNFNTSKVTTMLYMFSEMSSLTNLDLSGFDTSNVIDMSDMFRSSVKLSSIIYGTNFIRKSDSNISYMYDYCPANKPTDPSWDGATY